MSEARLKWPETNEISSVTAPISTRSAVALLVTSSCLGCFTCLFFSTISARIFVDFCRISQLHHQTLPSPLD